MEKDRVIEAVVFEINNKQYGISVHATKEVIKIPEIVPIPNAPSFIAGVINLRGNIICVIDLRKQFNFHSENNENSRIMVVKMNGMIIGLIVDKVYEVLKISKFQIDPIPPILNIQIPKNCLIGIAKVENKILTLINLDKILSSEQVNQINQTSVA